MKVRKGDTVKILQGKDRNKKGEVVGVYPKLDKVLVKGINIVTRHTKKRREDKQSGLIKIEAPIHVSNVHVVDQKTGESGRVGYIIQNGKKERVIKPKKVRKSATSKKKSVEKEDVATEKSAEKKAVTKSVKTAKKTTDTKKV